MIVGKPIKLSAAADGRAATGTAAGASRALARASGGIALALTLAGVLTALPAAAQNFKFSNEDPAEKADKEAQAKKQGQVQAMLDTPCRDKIKNQKIMVMFGEERDGVVSSGQGSYSAHVNAVNDRLTALGLKTFTQAQIRAQVAQAEINAVFKNDPDAAISASRRLAAQFILRGVISSSARTNAVINLNQVNVAMNFTLTGADGRMVSQASAKNASYAGADVGGMALTLINESAEEVVAQLYSDYCQKSGISMDAKSAAKPAAKAGAKPAAQAAGKTPNKAAAN